MPLRRAFLRRLRVLRALFLLGQANAPVRVFVDLPALLHFSRELHQRAAARVAQVERRRDFAQALRLAGPREMRHDSASVTGARGSSWRGMETAIVCALRAKREGWAEESLVTLCLIRKHRCTASGGFLACKIE